MVCSIYYQVCGRHQGKRDAKRNDKPHVHENQKRSGNAPRTGSRKAASKDATEGGENDKDKP